MSKSDKIEIPTVVIGGITVKRWWRSREAWNAIFGALVSVVSGAILLGAAIAPEILPLLHTLGLSPITLVLWTVALNAVVHIGQFILKLRSTSVIGNKTDVAEAKATDE